MELAEVSVGGRQVANSINLDTDEVDGELDRHVSDFVRCVITRAARELEEEMTTTLAVSKVAEIMSDVRSSSELKPKAVPDSDPETEVPKSIVKRHPLHTVSGPEGEASIAGQTARRASRTSTGKRSLATFGEAQKSRRPMRVHLLTELANRSAFSAPPAVCNTSVVVPQRNAYSAPPIVSDRFIPEDEYIKLCNEGHFQAPVELISPHIDELHTILSLLARTIPTLGIAGMRLVEFAEKIEACDTAKIVSIKGDWDRDHPAIEITVFGDLPDECSITSIGIPFRSPILKIFTISESAIVNNTRVIRFAVNKK